MLRYRPPKSSVWGHGLRRLQLHHVRQRIHSFLAGVADDYRFLRGNVWTSNADADVIKLYEETAGKLAQHHRIADLEREASERCLDQLIRDDLEFRVNEIHLSVWHEYEVTAWKRRASDEPTLSRLVVQYDTHPHLGTELTFESNEQFTFVSNALHQAGLCALNPKHLKSVTRGSRAATDA